MPDSGDPYQIGYRKPPKRTRFAKGQSGNPKGRPKGSQNLSTIFDKATRERVAVTTRGRTRSITKFEATMLQLTNKAASGDLKAINELRYWLQWMANAQETAACSPVMHESDNVVMASIIQRVRNSDDDLPSNSGADPEATHTSEGGE